MKFMAEQSGIYSQQSNLEENILKSINSDEFSRTIFMVPSIFVVVFCQLS